MSMPDGATTEESSGVGERARFRGEGDCAGGLIGIYGGEARGELNRCTVSRVLSEREGRGAGGGGEHRGAAQRE